MLACAVMDPAVINTVNAPGSLASRRSTFAPAPGSTLGRWRVLTLQGNLAFERGHDVLARQRHEEALAVAGELFAAAEAGHADAERCAPTLHGISCNSIVALARRQGDDATAGVYLYRAVEQLLTTIESEQSPLGLRSRCLKHLSVASVAVYHYFEQHGMWHAAEAFTQRANAALFLLERGPRAEAPVAPAAQRPAVWGPSDPLAAGGAASR